MTRTFVDAGVLIAAACGLPRIAERALRVLDDPDRTLVTSDFVRLEVLPKPSFHGCEDQVAFYEEFFASARSIAMSKRLMEIAVRDGCRFGLTACDEGSHDSESNPRSQPRMATVLNQIAGS